MDYPPRVKKATAAELTKMFMGSGGGGGNYTCSPCTGGAGGDGGGGLYISVYTADFEGEITADGLAGVCGASNSQGGGGSGGHIRIEGVSVTINSLSALGGQGCGNAGDGGNGRIAIYAESLSYNSSNPAPNTSGATPTPGPTPTATPAPEPDWQDSWYLYEGEQPHAVTSVQKGEDQDNYVYDANGNMTGRLEGETEWEQQFNAENRLSSLSDGEDTWTFTYDGDGNRVKQIGPTGEVTLYLGGGLIEVRDAAGDAEFVKYYRVASQRVAMNGPNGLQYLLTDHLGSVSAVLDDTGAMLSQQRYMPFGQPRFGVGIAETDYGYTGQRSLAGTGLLDYNARFYNANLNRFTQADTLVPGLAKPQSLNRFTYVLNNPLNFTDPTGHCASGIVLDNQCLEPYAPNAGYRLQTRAQALSTTPPGFQYPTVQAVPTPGVGTPTPPSGGGNSIGTNLSGEQNLHIDVASLVPCNLNSDYLCKHPDDEYGYYYSYEYSMSPSQYISLGTKAFVIVSFVAVTFYAAPVGILVFAVVADLGVSVGQTLIDPHSNAAEFQAGSSPMADPGRKFTLGHSI